MADDGLSKDERDALREAYCPRCKKWYNVKRDGKKHKGH